MDWLKPGEVDSVEQIAPGRGAVVRRGIHKIAAYRDRQGALHERSAKCTHLGCIVRWNHADNTWDCPCHGSRFDSLGHVVSGPAVTDLEPVEISAPGGGAAAAAPQDRPPQPPA
jgi:Rieske Fe-S protein